MASPDSILCVDWGTSSFRIHFVDMASGTVQASWSGARGILDTYNAWISAGKPDRISFYRPTLEIAISTLAQQLGRSLDGIPLVVSGMPSSSIGMHELPYGVLPQNLDKPNLPYVIMDAETSFPHRILLLSGLRKEGDVMRGEEVQSFGLYEKIGKLPEKAVMILPGTHSKHMLLESGTIRDFSTFMTGELYSILGKHSILRQSIGDSIGDDAELQDQTFEAGLELGRKGILGRDLFAVRARFLEGKLSPDYGRAYLIGILIGHELSGLEDGDAKIILAAGKLQLPAYQHALEFMGLGDRLITLSSEDTEQLVVQGQRAIWHSIE